jgi:WD40 repeat protein
MSRIVLVAVLAFGTLTAGAMAQGQAGAANAPRARQLWAIIVGAGSPMDPRLRQESSREAVVQAYKVLGWLSGTAGWDRRHLLLLTDLGGSENPGSPMAPAPNIAPTRRNLDWVFQKWLPAHAQPGDVVLFYYAGLSRALVGKDPLAPPDYYLLPSDTLLDNLADRGWPLDRSLDATARQGKYRIVCWLGTSLQVQGPSGTEAGRKIDRSRLSRDWIERVARWPGVSVWLAADHSVAGPGTHPSIGFTGAVLDALGTRDNRQNLSGALRTLYADSKLKVSGFQTIGGIPPDLSLWPDQLGPPSRPARPEMVLQIGHAERVEDLVSTPDSRLVISASQDSTIRVWAPEQKVLLRILTGHAVGATALAISRDGKWLVSGGGLGEVLVHDLSNNFTARPVLVQPHETGVRVDQVTVLPDDRHFVTVDRRGVSYLWDLADPSLSSRAWIEGTTCRRVAGGGKAADGAVAVLCGDGSVRLFAASGTGGAPLELPGCQPSSVAVSGDGSLVAIGCEDGRVLVRALNGGKQFEYKAAEESIERLAFSAGNLLAIGHARGVRLLRVKPGVVAGDDLELWNKGVERIAFSPDGSSMAACARNTGELKVWKLEGDAPPRLVVDDPGEGIFSLAFSSDGHRLLAGTKLGSIRLRPLDDARENRGWDVAANRGRVQQVVTSPGRGSLLIINELQQAYLWNLKERTCRRLPGIWSNGVFVGRETLVLAGRKERGHPARLVRVEAATGAPVGPAFADKSGDFQVPADVSFESLALSPDGRTIAASAGRSQVPLVCVWEASTGRLTHWASDDALSHPGCSLSLSDDGRFLLTAGDSPQAELWDLARGEGAMATPAVTFRDSTSKDITSARLRPGPHRQMVSGHSDGRLLLWSWKDGEAKREVPAQILAERFFYGAVHAITFTPDGHYLAASGVGNNLWTAEMEPSVRPIRNLATYPHHLEQINTLDVWPDHTPLVRLLLARTLAPDMPLLPQPPRAPLMVSGSDDTTVRFWDLESRQLRGTFCASAVVNEAPAPGLRQQGQELDWVLFTPEGFFDAARQGRDLVRFREGDTGRPLEQFDGTSLYAFELSDRLRMGLTLEPQALETPPPVAIDPPPQLGDDPTPVEVQLTVSLGSDNLRDVRIYHNGVPVPSGLEEANPPLPDRFYVRVKLVPGENRFYAMASRDGAYDSRSGDIQLRYDGPADLGRLHVVALGVENYQREQLRFATDDARRISQVLHAQGLGQGQEPGELYLLTDQEVNARAVMRAFSSVARKVRGRPQDTVVLFLAGHTGVFDQERFCLLLPRYPFPEESPVMVAARGTNPPLAPGETVSAEDVLPISTLTVNLMRMEALNRLVIVDACQAEAIFLDPQVQSIRKWMEISSRKTRTSYLMATRRGEPALEVEPLRHGLFTYTLLRGMGDIGPNQEPAEISRLNLRGDADFNGDGIITIAELDDYVKQVMPPLSKLYPDMAVSRNGPRQGARNQPITAEQLDQQLRLQTEETSFPLIRLDHAREAGAVP